MPGAVDDEAKSPVCPMCGEALRDSLARCGHCGENISPAIAPARGFRWQIIPTVLLGGYGSLMVIVGTLSLAATAFATVVSIRSMAMRGVFGISIGSLCCLAAWTWWTGRWRLAVTITLLLFPAGLALLWLFGQL